MESVPEVGPAWGQYRAHPSRRFLGLGVGLAGLCESAGPLARKLGLSFDSAGYQKALRHKAFPRT
jgi:hypothetical protein